LAIANRRNAATITQMNTDEFQILPFQVIGCLFGNKFVTGTMKAIQELNLKTGKDIAVIAMSNGYIPKLYAPEITYVETSGFKLGKLAFSRMMACMAGSTFMQELTQDCNLVPGKSI